MKGPYFLAAALAATAITATAPAAAAVITYGDRGSFNAAAGAITTEDFNSCTGTTGVAGTLSAATPGNCASLAGGISYSPDPGFNLYIAAPGQSANATTALGVDLPLSGNIRIAFDGGSNAFAADFNQNFGGGFQSGSPASFILEAFDTNGALLDSFSFLVDSDASNFFGITSTTVLGGVWVRQIGGYAVIDDVSFNGGNAVPLPGTLALFGLGLASLGLSRRRRTR